MRGLTDSQFQELMGTDIICHANQDDAWLAIMSQKVRLVEHYNSHGCPCVPWMHFHVVILKTDYVHHKTNREACLLHKVIGSLASRPLPNRFAGQGSGTIP